MRFVLGKRHNCIVAHNKNYKDMVFKKADTQRVIRALKAHFGFERIRVRRNQLVGILPKDYKK